MTVDEDETTSSSDKKTKPTVKHLTEDELEKYTIYDIVLPLPGYDVVLPANEVSFILHELSYLLICILIKFLFNLPDPTQRK